MLRTLRSASGLVLLTLPAFAGDLQGAWLPRDTSWVLHVDVGELVASQTFAHVKEQAVAQGEWQPDQWAEGKLAELDFDLLEDLESITVFGAGADGQQGVLLAETSVKIDGVFEELRGQQGHQTLDRGGLRLESFDGEGYAWVHHPQGEGHHVLLAANDPDLLVRAVRTFQGLEPNALGRAEAPLDLQPRPGAFAFVSASMDFSGVSAFESMAHATKLVSGFTAMVGEDRHGLFVELAAQTASTEDAANLRRIIDGLRALVALAGDEMPVEALELLDAIRIDLTGSRVSLSFGMPVQELVEHLRALEEGEL